MSKDNLYVLIPLRMLMTKKFWWTRDLTTKEACVISLLNPSLLIAFNDHHLIFKLGSLPSFQSISFDHDECKFVYLLPYTNIILIHRGAEKPTSNPYGYDHSGSKVSRYSLYF